MAKIKDMAKRQMIQSDIDEVVSSLRESPNFNQLLRETANQESHFGELDSNNVFRVDPIQRQEMLKTKYTPQLSFLGARQDGKDFDLSDGRTSASLAAMRYVTNPYMKTADLKTLSGRAKAWKEAYNTKSGKGTVEQYMETNKDG